MPQPSRGAPARHPAARVAVLLPVRNAAATLPDALESLASQTLREFRIYAVDDGSTDDTPRILAEEKRRNPSLHVIRTEPGGSIAIALARAAEAGNEELLARMDADDLVHPTRFAQQLAFLDAHPEVSLVASNYEPIGEHPESDGAKRYRNWLESCRTPRDIANNLWIESPLPHPSVMMRRTAYEAAGGYRDRGWPEDYDLWLRFARRGFLMAKLEQRLLQWRDSNTRASRVQSVYSTPAFLACRVHHLTKFLDGRPVVIWGAGRDGRRAGRALISKGVSVERFLDIDPRKIGRTAYTRPIVRAEEWLSACFTPAPHETPLDSSRVASPRTLRRDAPIVLAAVGTAGAREWIRAALEARGAREGIDSLCVA